MNGAVLRAEQDRGGSAARGRLNLAAGCVADCGRDRPGVGPDGRARDQEGRRRLNPESGKSARVVQEPSLVSGAIAAGGALIDPLTTRRFIGRFASVVRPARAVPSVLGELTGLELDVLRLVAEGPRTAMPIRNSAMDSIPNNVGLGLVGRRFRPDEYRVFGDVQGDQRGHPDYSRQGGALDHFPLRLPACIRSNAGPPLADERGKDQPEGQDDRGHHHVPDHPRELSHHPRRANGITETDVGGLVNVRLVLTDAARRRLPPHHPGGGSGRGLRPEEDKLPFVRKVKTIVSNGRRFLLADPGSADKSGLPVQGRQVMTL